MIRRNYQYRRNHLVKEESLSERGIAHYRRNLSLVI